MSLASVSDISERSREVRPGNVLAAAGRGIGGAIEAVFMTVFALIGWVLGVVWRLCASSAMALEYGFRSAAGWPQREPESGETPPGV